MTDKFDFESWLTQGLAEAAHALFTEMLGTPVERTNNPREDIFAAFKKVCADMDEHNRKVHEKLQEDFFERALDAFKTTYQPNSSRISALQCDIEGHSGRPNAGTFVRNYGSQQAAWTCIRCKTTFIPVTSQEGWIWRRAGKTRKNTDVRHLTLPTGMSVCKNEAFVYGPLVSIKPQEGVTAAMQKWPICPDCKRVVMEWWS